jgi:hypothetical protein
MKGFILDQALKGFIFLIRYNLSIDEESLKPAYDCLKEMTNALGQIMQVVKDDKKTIEEMIRGYQESKIRRTR